MSRRNPKQVLHRELDDLQDRLMEMAGLAEELVSRAVRAFLHRDGKAVSGIRAEDRRVDALEMALDEKVVTLIALYQPVASDLRQVLATLRISKDIERIADHALNIAKAARRLGKSRPMEDIPELAELAFLTERMLRDALSALGSRNSDLAREVCARDDRVDEMKRSVQQLLVALMTQDPRIVQSAVEYIRVAQQLERIGDLSTNVSEEVVFLVEGRSIKHHGRDRPPPPGDSGV